MGAAMRYQPQGLTRLNTGNAIARKVTALFALNGNFASVVNQGNAQPVVTSGPTFAYGPDGAYALGNGSGAVNTGITPARLGMAGAAPRTIIAAFYMPDAAVARLLYSFGDQSTGARTQFSLVTNFDYRTVRLNLYSNDYNFAVHGVPGTGARVFLAITYDGATSIRFQSWSKLDTTGQVIYSSQTSSLTAPLATGVTVPLSLMGGGTYPGSWSSLNGPLNYLAFFGGSVLSDAEIFSLYGNRWQVFDAGPNLAQLAAIASVSAPVGGATATSVNPGAGLLSLTGYALTVDRGAAIGVSPAAAALSITGYAPSVAQPHAAAPGAALASLTGYAPTVTQGLTQNMALSAASMAIAGYPPAVAQSALRTAAPGAGAVAITGYAPTVTRGASLAVQVAAAALAITGYAPTVAQQIPVIKFTVRFDVLPRNFNLKTIHFSN